LSIAVNRADRSWLYRTLPTGGTMIRAFALLSFTMLVACASSHAAKSSGPEGTWVAGHPEDPYVTTVSIGGRGTQFCGPGDSCSFECPEGGCAFTCAEGSSCNVECDGGRCKTSCGINASCNVECDGGQCGTGCGAGASCNIECDGGGCAQACASEASCNTDCDGGGCS
jgi:hypothetical protein